MRLDDFSPQHFGPSQIGAQQGLPPCQRAAPEAILEEKAHPIADKALQPLAGCRGHYWYHWLHGWLPAASPSHLAYFSAGCNASKSPGIRQECLPMKQSAAPAKESCPGGDNF